MMQIQLLRVILLVEQVIHLQGGQLNQMVLVMVIIGLVGVANGHILMDNMVLVMVS